MKNSLSLVEIHGGEQVEQRYIYDSEFIVGRGEDVGVLVPSLAISRHHFTVQVRERSLWIKDLGSSNGTKISGRDIGNELKIPYAPGEQIRFGDKNLYIVIYLYQIPMGKYETADDIVQDAFINAEAVKTAAHKEIDEFRIKNEKELQEEREKFLEWKKTEEESLVKIYEHKARQEAQKKIEESLQDGLRVAAEKATHLEKEIQQNAHKEAEALLQATLKDGHNQVADLLKKAQDDAHAAQKTLLEKTQKIAEEQIKISRHKSAKMLLLYRKKGKETRTKIEEKVSYLHDEIKNLEERRTKATEQTQQATADMALAATEKSRVMKQLEEIQKDAKEKADMLQNLKNNVQHQHTEVQKKEKMTSILNEQIQKLEIKLAEATEARRQQEAALRKSEQDLLENEKKVYRQEQKILHSLEKAKDLKTKQEKKWEIEFSRLRATQEEELADDLKKIQDNIAQRKATYEKELEDCQKANSALVCEEIENFVFPKIQSAVTNSESILMEWRQELPTQIDGILKRQLVKAELKSLSHDRSQRKKRFTIRRPSWAAATISALTLFFFGWLFASFVDQKIPAAGFVRSRTDHVLQIGKTSYTKERVPASE